MNPSGIYHLDAGQTAHVIAVNVPAVESKLGTMNLAGIYPDWYEAGARQCGPDQLAETVRKSRYGREVWKLALIACFGLLLLESVLGSTWKKTTLMETSEIEKL